MKQLKSSGNFTEQLPAASSNSSNITNNNNENGGGGYTSIEVSRNNTTSNVNLFGGMEVLKTRQKRRGTSTVGSHTPHTDSLIPLPPKDQLSPVESSTKEKTFFMRYDMQVGNLQDDVEDPQVTRMRERLERFYNEYCPSMLSTVENNIKSFFGREEELFELLVAEYGPEPVVLRPSVLPKNDFVNPFTQSEAGSVFDFIQSGPKQSYVENLKNNNNDILVNTASSQDFPLPQTSVKESENCHEDSVPAVSSGFSFIEANSKGGSVFEFVAAKSDRNETIIENMKPPAITTTTTTSTTRVPQEHKEDETEEEEKEEGENISLPLQRNTESAFLEANNNNGDNKSRSEDSTSNLSKNESSRRISISSSYNNNEENLWDRQRREIGEFQRDVLQARAKLAHVLSQIRNSILERRDAISKVKRIEEDIEKCVAQEAFDKADIMSNELEQLTSHIVELDAEPTRLLVLFAQFKEELNSAVRHLAHLLLRHREELIACKDDEEKRVKKFISDMTFNLENRSDKVAAALERAQRTKSNALQETADLSERKRKIGEKMQRQSKDIRAQQEQLTCDMAELNAEITALEVKLTQLKQTQAEKAAALKEISSNVQRITEEREALENEVDALIKEEESRANAAADDIVNLQERNEALEREKKEFEAKKDFLLMELQSGVAKIDGYNDRRVSLETNTIDTLQRCSKALEVMLQTRAAGCGILYTAVPSLRSTATCAEEYPLAQVHRLQKQLRTLNADDERNTELITSLNVQITEIRNGIPLLEDAKKSAVQAKRFKEAQLKAEELRALTVSIEELTATKESTEELLRTNASKRTELRKELAYEQSKASKSVKVFLDRYRNVLSAAMEATATPPNVLQIEVDEQHESDELAEAMGELVETLQEEWLSVPKINNEDGDEDAVNIVDSNSNSGDGCSTHNGANNDATGTIVNANTSPTDFTTVGSTREEIEEKLLMLQKRQNEALEIEDYETCDRLQEQIEVFAKLLGPQVSIS